MSDGTKPHHGTKPHQKLSKSKSNPVENDSPSLLNGLRHVNTVILESPHKTRRYHMPNKLSVKHLHRAYKIFHAPSTWEVLQNPQFGHLKIPWLIMSLVASLIMFNQLVTITTELFEEKLGTGTTFDTMQSKFINPNLFKTMICPHDWINGSKLIKHNISSEMYTYILGYLFFFEQDKFPQNISNDSKIKVEHLSNEFGGIRGLIFELMKDYNVQHFTPESIVYISSADGYIPCLEIDSEHEFDLSGDLTLHYKPNLFALYSNFSTNDGKKRRNTSPYIGHYYGSRPALLSVSRVHFYTVMHRTSYLAIRLRHFKRYSGRSHVCIPNGENEVLPMGYAKHICASDCWHDAVSLLLNCSFYPLFEPARNVHNRSMCNIFSDQGETVTRIIEIQKQEAYRCAQHKQCTKLAYCDEWTISVLPQQGEIGCYEDGKFICTDFELIGSVSDNVETLTEYPLRTFSNVLSDYGGQLGLWVGVSILGIMHLIIHVCWHWRTIKNKYCGPPNRNRRFPVQDDEEDQAELAKISVKRKATNSNYSIRAYESAGETTTESVKLNNVLQSYQKDYDVNNTKETNYCRSCRNNLDFRFRQNII